MRFLSLEYLNQNSEDQTDIYKHIYYRKTMKIEHISVYIMTTPAALGGSEVVAGLQVLNSILTILFLKKYCLSFV